MARRPPVVVRRAEARDADALLAIFATPRAMAGTLQLPYPSAVAWSRRIADIPADEFLLVAEVDGQVVGNLGLHAASKSPRRRHAGMIGMSVRDDWHGRGVGTALLRAALDLADNWIGYARLDAAKSRRVTSRKNTKTERKPKH
jgi:L-phenylalanine/L-methionine N-acetyltransferase